MFYLNKPLSPHLTIYKIQSSSLVSLLHRITSIFVLILCIFYLFRYEFCFNIFYYNFLISYKLTYNVLHFVIYSLSLLSLFHFINGLKIILWNYNIFNKFNYLNYINLSIFFFIFIIFFLF